MNYSIHIGYQSKTDIKKAQEEKLQHTLAYLQQFSPFYSNLFLSHKINITQIKTLQQLVHLPTTSKEDLQQNNDAFLCVPKNKIIEYTATSGTLGSPVTIALTENDLQRLAFNEYASFLCANGNAADIYQLMLTLDKQFMAGIAYYSGIRKMGAGIIRVGPGAPSMQWQIIQRIQPTAIVGVPSFIVKLIQYAKENNIDISNTSVKKAICIGENIRNTDFSLNILGKKITDSWNIQLYATYASTEMQTAFTECEAGKGGHHNPELVIVELLDDNNKPVSVGQPGEVVITTLGVEAMPLLRYKTGDICMYTEDSCSCGRNTLRLSPVIGRKKQMIKYKGTTLYPPALFDVLNEMEEVLDYVVEVYSNDIEVDEIIVHVVPSNHSLQTDAQIKSYITAKLRVSPQVIYVSIADIQKMQFSETGRKMLKFIDRRN